MAVTTLDPSVSRHQTPAVVTVYRTLDSGIHHARCGRRIEYTGSRGGLELDFYCFACHEHVTLPECVIAHVPVATSGKRPA